MEGGDEQRHLGQMAHYHQNCVPSLRQGQPPDEIHRDRVPGSFTDWEESMRAKWLVVEGLAATAERTRVDVVGNEGDHSGPIELTTDVLDHLGDGRMSSQAMVVVGVKDVQLDILIVGDIEQSLIV